MKFYDPVTEFDKALAYLRHLHWTPRPYSGAEIRFHSGEHMPCSLADHPTTKPATDDKNVSVHNLGGQDVAVDSSVDKVHGSSDSDNRPN